MSYTVVQSKEWPFKVRIMLGPITIAYFECGISGGELKDVDAHNAHPLNEDTLARAQRACDGLNKKINESARAPQWQDFADVPHDKVIDLWHKTAGRVVDCWWSDGWAGGAIGMVDEDFTHYMEQPEPPSAVS